MQIDDDVLLKIKSDYNALPPVFGPTGKINQVQVNDDAVVLTVTDYLMEGHVKYLVTIHNDDISITGFGALRDTFLSSHLKWVVKYYVSA